MTTPAPAPGAPPPAAAAAAAPSTRPLHVVRLACDSENLGALIGTPFVRTYSDLIKSPGALDDLRGRFPDSIIELIDRGLGDPSELATIADIERGALTIAQLPGWFDAKHAAGLRDLIAYCSLDNLAAVLAALDGRPHWNWIAWFGHLSIPERPDAQVQCITGPMIGADVDLTLVPNYRYRPTRIPVGPAAASILAALAEPGAGPVVLAEPAAASTGAAAVLGGDAMAPALAPAIAPSPAPGRELADLFKPRDFLAPAPHTWPLAAYFHTGRLAEHLGSLERDLASLRTIIRAGLPAEDIASGLIDLLS